MTKRKAKRNVRTSKMRVGFKISPEPVVRAGVAVQSRDVHERTRLPQVCERRMLFAIARDEHMIFVSWDIDWRSVFDKAMPVNRQVHLRLISGAGFEQKTIGVEPMLGIAFVSVPQSRETYRVELGYYTRGRGWKSVATCDAIAMPADAAYRNGQGDFATVPFHINFQKIVDLLSLTDREPLVTALSSLGDRIVTSAPRDGDLAPADREILGALNMSIDDLRNSRVSFANAPNKLQMRKCAEVILDVRGTATSPTNGFGALRQ
jgi:hypothetical protein